MPTTQQKSENFERDRERTFYSFGGGISKNGGRKNFKSSGENKKRRNQNLLERWQEGTNLGGYYQYFE